MVEQNLRERAGDHRPAPKTHDGHACRHASAVGKPLDKCRDRRDVSQTESAPAQHAIPDIKEPDLMLLYAQRRDQKTEAPTAGGYETTLTRSGMLEPAAECCS